MSRGTSKELVFGLSYLKAPLPIKPLAILLYLDRSGAFEFSGKAVLPQMGTRNPDKTISIVDGKHQSLRETCLKLPFRT